MATRYNYTGNIVTQGLVLNLDAAKTDSYPGTGTTWRDLSGFGNNGTLTNGPTFSGLGKQASIVFDGTNDYVTGSNSSDFAFGTGDFTVSTWAYFNTVADGIMVDLRTTSTGGGPGYSDYLQNGKFKLYWTGDRYTSIGNLTTGSWYSITVTRQSTTLSVYFNGVLDGTTFSNTNLTEGGFRLATNINSTGYANERIANVLIYKGKALTPSEVTQNFNALRGRYGI